MVKANYSKELNEVELKRLGCALYEEGNLCMALDEAILNSFEMIFSDEEEWEEYDQSCKEDSIKEILRLQEGD